MVNASREGPCLPRAVQPTCPGIVPYVLPQGQKLLSHYAAPSQASKKLAAFLPVEKTSPATLTAHLPSPVLKPVA